MNYISPHSGYEQFGSTTDILLLMLPLVMLAIIWLAVRIIGRVVEVVKEAEDEPCERCDKYHAKNKDGDWMSDREDYRIGIERNHRDE